ncbi:RpiR family transcriptional regulator [Ensifer sp. Root31]|uniref:MurR/RpiR family transcriptional regulator n=1 Tax=Ensifer sp. Root31 TaxID=1736512 RepID=UPI00070E90C6|nr:MurR/RpiR family transcriptional regulator [Ensifer sp. Root31]KQU86330.1 RpiR family transcriptional regulator [Ensifer sp. Root31]
MSEVIRDRLNASLSAASAAESSIAHYMLTNLNSLPFENANTLAVKIGVSAVTIGRFCRKLGYKHFKELKNELGGSIGNQPWLVGDRLKEFNEQSNQGNSSAKVLEKEIAALVHIHEFAQRPEWKRAAKRLATAKKVFVVGFQTERGLAQYFANQLQYLRDGVVIVDTSNGNFLEILLTEHSDSALVMFEARKYSSLAAMLAQQAKSLGISITLFTDPYCHWCRGVSTETFNVPTDLGTFWDSTAMMAVLGNLLLNDVFNQIGTSVEDRMNKVSYFYKHFTGHTK